MPEYENNGQAVNLFLVEIRGHLRERTSVRWREIAKKVQIQELRLGSHSRGTFSWNYKVKFKEYLPQGNNLVIDNLSKVREN